MADRNNTDNFDNSLLPVIEGQYKEVADPSSVSHDYAKAVDTIPYFNKELISPMSYAEQLAMINTPPNMTDLVDGWQNKFKYLPIAYIENRLTDVYGTNNWKHVSRTLIPTELFRNDNMAVYVDICFLVLTWANGEQTKVEGMGESRFEFKNVKVPSSITNSWRIARQESLKDAAKKLGALFGKGMKEFMEDGTMGDNSSKTEMDTIIKSIGSRIWVPSGLIAEPVETVFDCELLDQFIMFYTGESLDTLTTKGIGVIASALKSLPTLADKADYMQRGVKLGMKFTITTTFEEMKTLVDMEEKTIINDAGNVFKKRKGR